MLFTREPIIETVIAAREGRQLILRSSKGGRHEELTCEAVEVVTFASGVFFRSREKSRPFLVPATDFELHESKEMRPPLKMVSADRAGRATGNKEQGPREGGGETHRRERPAKGSAPPAPAVTEVEQAESLDEAGAEGAGDRRRRRRRRRGGRGDRTEEGGAAESADTPKDEMAHLEAVAQTLPSDGVSGDGEGQPPAGLARKTLSKYREGRAPEVATPDESVESSLFFAEEETPAE